MTQTHTAKVASGEMRYFPAPEKVVTRWATASLSVLAVWAVMGWWAAPRAISLAWATESGGLLDQIMAGRRHLPLEVYLTAWASMRLKITIVLVVGLALGLSWVLVRPAFLRAAAVVFGSGCATRQELFAGAAWVGLVSGSVQAAIVWIKQSLWPEPSFLYSWDVVWVAPVVTGFVFVFAAVVWAILSGFTILALSWRALVFMGAGALVLGAVQSAGLGVHPMAAALLATGVGINAARTWPRYDQRLKRLVRTSLPALTASIIGLACARATLAIAGAQQKHTPTSQSAWWQYPNVLLVILDTVRQHNLSLYGYHRITTPRLDEFARRGVVFERAVAPSSWTLPSHASVFTGLHPHQLGADWSTVLGSGPITLAEVLASLGYATGGFVANVWYAGKTSGLDRGFDVYRDHRLNLMTAVRSSWVTHAIADALRYDSANMLGRKSAADVNREFLRWLDEEVSGQPFFAFLNYFDAHYPYGAPEAVEVESAQSRQSSVKSDGAELMAGAGGAEPPPVPEYLRRDHDRYDDGIRYMDRELGRLFDELESRHVLSNTLVIVTSDHGEQFGEVRGDLTAHGNSLYHSTLAVPLVLVFPGRIPPGRRVAAVVETRMIAATVLDALVDSGDVQPFAGPSLADYWSSSADPIQDLQPLALVNPGPWATDTDPVSKGPIWSLIDGSNQYILNGDGTEELYDLAADPWNRQDLAGDQGCKGALTVFRESLLSRIEDDWTRGQASGSRPATNFEPPRPTLQDSAGLRRVRDRLNDACRFNGSDAH